VGIASAKLPQLEPTTQIAQALNLDANQRPNYETVLKSRFWLNNLVAKSRL